MKALFVDLEHMLCIILCLESSAEMIITIEPVYRVAKIIESDWIKQIFKSFPLVVKEFKSDECESMYERPCSVDARLPMHCVIASYSGGESSKRACSNNIT